MKLKGLEFDEAGKIALVREQRIAGLFEIGVDDLESLQADQKYVTARGVGCEVTLEPALCAIERLLPAGFVRLSRGTVVALGKVSMVKKVAAEDGGHRLIARMAGGDTFEVSRRNWSAFRLAMKSHAGGV